MTIRYAPRALQDIDDILAYIHERNPEGALNVSLAIKHTITICANYPRTGAVTDNPGVYRRPLSRYQFTLFYRMMSYPQGIEVVRVVRSARVKNLRIVPEGE